MTHVPVQNLLGSLPSEVPNELHETLAKGKNIRIDRIVSAGHASDSETWYDQDQSEWILVLQGEAKLKFDDDDADLVHLCSGDWMNIPARRRHRVDWTCGDPLTVWLAIYYDT